MEAHHFVAVSSAASCAAPEAHSNTVGFELSDSEGWVVDAEEHFNFSTEWRPAGGPAGGEDELDYAAGGVAGGELLQ